MHLGNAFVRYLCVIIFKLFLVIRIMRFFFKIENLGILTSFSIAWRVDRVGSRNRWLEVDFELGQEVDTKYSGRARMLIPKPGPAISLATREHAQLIKISLDLENVSQIILDLRLQVATRNNYLDVMERLLQAKTNVNATIAKYDGKAAL